MPLSQALKDQVVKEYIPRYGTKRAALVMALWMAQNEQGWLSDETCEEIGELLDLQAADVAAVASFYTMFHRRPIGTKLVEVCDNPSCLINGAQETMHRLCERLGVESAAGHGGGTTADGEYTLRYAECLAACDKAPAVQVNYRYYGPVRPDDVERFLANRDAFSLETPIPPVPGQSGSLAGRIED
ncbi:MAG: NAD(P)H-dependent oxidoreductase subunit E [Chloroflexota bacterium]